jgi:hypothetical protein
MRCLWEGEETSLRTRSNGVPVDAAIMSNCSASSSLD